MTTTPNNPTPDIDLLAGSVPLHEIDIWDAVPPGYAGMPCDLIYRRRVGSSPWLYVAFRNGSWRYGYVYFLTGGISHYSYDLIGECPTLEQAMAAALGGTPCQR